MPLPVYVDRTAPARVMRVLDRRLACRPESSAAGERSNSMKRAPIVGTRRAGLIRYMLKPWISFTRFVGDARICLTNNAGKHALRGGTGQQGSATRRFRSRRRAGRAAVYS